MTNPIPTPPTPPLSMYQASVPVFIRALTQCAAVLAKALDHARQGGLDPDTLLGERLAPDMLPLVRQVQIATDGARGSAARLAGIAPPTPEAADYAVFNRSGDQGFAPAETRIEQLIARIRQTIAYLQELDPARFDGAETRPIVLAMYGRTRAFSGLPFLQYYVLPNLYFHLTIVYAILRHRGVPLGKQDFEGAPVYLSGVSGDATGAIAP